VNFDLIDVGPIRRRSMMTFDCAARSTASKTAARGPTISELEKLLAPADGMVDLADMETLCDFQIASKRLRELNEKNRKFYSGGKPAA
jgi:hypothetical protein